MAGPISHIVYAEKALRSFLQGRDEDQFIVGTLLPDIRYLGVIAREATHRTGLTLADVQQEPDSFRAGMLFHSLIDEVREAFVVRSGVYDELPPSQLLAVALKICEDAKTYTLSSDWRTYIGYLETIKPSEQTFGIPAQKLRQWHAMHAALFADPSPSKNSAFFETLGFSPAQTAQTAALINQITTRNLVDEYISDFYQNLEKYLSDQQLI